MKQLFIDIKKSEKTENKLKQYTTIYNEIKKYKSQKEDTKNAI